MARRWIRGTIEWLCTQIKIAVLEVSEKNYRWKTRTRMANVKFDTYEASLTNIERFGTIARRVHKINIFIYFSCATSNWVQGYWNEMVHRGYQCCFHKLYVTKEVDLEMLSIDVDSEQILYTLHMYIWYVGGIFLCNPCVSCQIELFNSVSTFYLWIIHIFIIYIFYNTIQMYLNIAYTFIWKSLNTKMYVYFYIWKWR